MVNRSKFSYEELAGQKLMVGFNSVEFDDEIKYLIRKLKVGGLIFFSRNIKSAEQVKLLCEKAQDYASSIGLLPLFMAVDQEGGQVARFKKPFTEFEGNPSINSIEQAEHYASTVANELKQVGINMNFAPVLDIVDQTKKSIMEKRAFRGDAARVAYLGCSVIENMQKEKVMAVAKHFPGIGRTRLDSHFELPVLDIDFQTLKENDLVPFIEAKKKDVSGIMLSHISYPRLDNQWQASLSVQIAKNLIREELGYDGIVMTDDLDMKSIRHDIPTIINQILAADIDMVLICHKGPNIKAAYNELLKQIKNDEAVLKKAVESMKRILKKKNAYLS